MPRDFERYLTDFKNLSFERIQESYRLKRLIELIPSNLNESSHVLEVGPGINPVFLHIQSEVNFDVIEPIKEFYHKNLDLIQNPKIVKIWNQTIEEFINENAQKKFDLVILSSVLHELENSKTVLLQLYNLIKKNGHVIIVVPNNKSVHRLISNDKNSHNDLNQLTNTEIQMQQTTSFSPKSLKQLLTESGFNDISVVTSFIKPMPHQSMENAMHSGAITMQHLDFLYDISQLLEGYGSEIFGVATK
jgi:SAM-dependent methyltransferase